jgi:hypothetical protein
MMEFVKELHEARLLKTQGDLKLSFSEVCDNIYYVILALEFLSRIKQGKGLSERYASLTSSYINYSEFKTSATDLYNLLYFVQQSPSEVEKTFNSEDARRLREKTQLPRMELNRWLINISSLYSRDMYFIMRIEQALNITSTDLREIRRLLMYKEPSNTDLDILATRLLNYVRFKMPLLDLKPDLEQVLNSRKYTYIK